MTYPDLALKQLDCLAEAIEYTTPTDHLQPSPNDLDALGAKLLHQTLAVRGFKLLSDTWHQNPYNILFDAEDILRHAFILEYMCKARFSPAIGHVKWHAGCQSIIGIERVEVLWVEASSEYEVWRDWEYALKIRLLWKEQVDLREAHKQIGLWMAKRQTAEKAIQDWTIRIRELEAKIQAVTASAQQFSHNPEPPQT